MRQWQQAQAIAVVGVLLFVLLAIPSADAADTLKTCACLLKECRYSARVCAFSFLYILSYFVRCAYKHVSTLNFLATPVFHI